LSVSFWYLYCPGAAERYQSGAGVWGLCLLKLDTLTELTTKQIPHHAFVFHLQPINQVGQYLSSVMLIQIQPRTYVYEIFVA
jgi:hypothetical protein